MNRKLNTSIALMAMFLMLFAFGGCSDDDGGTNPGPTPVDEFAVVAAAGDTYFGNYTVPFQGGQLGVNPDAASVYTIQTDADPNNDYYIIDWRSGTHYALGHIEGAVNMGLGSLVDEIDNLPTDKVILNVCYSGQTASTATAVINLIGSETGHAAQNLKFGMSGWTSDTVVVGTDYMAKTSSDFDGMFEQTINPMGPAVDYPTFDTGESEAVAILKARARDYIAAGWKKISGADMMTLELVNNPTDWYVINYFPEVNYNEGHMPGAIRYNPKTSLLTTSTLNTLPTDKKIGVYCWTGQTSAQVTAYLNMLGYDAYSVLYGVQALCYDNAIINDHKYTVPGTDNPVVQ